MVAKIIDQNISYVYPMANSLRGGAVASEYNIRSLFNMILSKSSAKSNEDFRIVQKTNDGYSPISNNSTVRSTSWYTVGEQYLNSQGETFSDVQFDFILSPGEGNCNGYFVNISEFKPMSISYPIKLSNADINTPNKILDIYLRIIYSGTGICDGLYLWVGDSDEVQSENTKFAKAGFYDIGIRLGSFTIGFNNNDSNGTNNLLNIRYLRNKNIMNCIDIDRFGSAEGSIAEQLYNRLNRLYQLMIDSGSISIGTVINSEFKPDERFDNHNFMDHISKYKVQMYLDYTETESTDANSHNYKYSGGLRCAVYSESDKSFVNPDYLYCSDDETVDKTEVSFIDVLKFYTDVNGKIEKIQLFEDGTPNFIAYKNQTRINTISTNMIHIGGEDAKYTGANDNFTSGIIMTLDKGDLLITGANSESVSLKIGDITANHIEANTIQGKTAVYGAVWN